MTRVGRLPDGVAPPSGERFVELARVGGALVEHITSSAAPDSAEQCQDHDEWVLLLSGAADLEIEGAVEHLGPGVWVLLPAGTPHRVLRTESGTRWLAIHGPVS